MGQIKRWRGQSWLPALASCVVAVSAAAAFAGSGTTTRSTGNGLSLIVSTLWVDGGGYRPVHLQIVPLAPLKSDRSVHIEFHAESYYGGSTEMVVSRDVDLPAGSTSVMATLPVPEHNAWTNIVVEVWVDGRYSKSLSQKSGLTFVPDWHEGLPNILVVADKPPATAPTGPVTPVPGTTFVIGGAKGVPVAGFALPNPETYGLAQLLPTDETAQYRGGQTATAKTKAGQTTYFPLDTIIQFPIDLLPTRWIEYSSLDIICLSLAQARTMAAEYPEAWSAIRAWTEAGGNLIVSDAGAGFVGLPELEKLLGVPSPAGDDVSDPAARGWAWPDAKDFRDGVEPPFNRDAARTARYYGAPAPPAAAVPAAVVVDGEAAPNAAAPAPPAAPNPPTIVMRPLLLGRVVAAASADLFAEPPEFWAWVLNTLKADRWLWYRRHGVSVQRENGGFWNWLVEGVGAAPVTEFRVLITFFVLAIGPLNYVWLRRRGKLHLLLIVAPLAAALITLGLFGYALVADGLDVRVRDRSFTLIDQRRGEAVCWSRVSYYAGLTPSSGIVLPDDVLVIPVEPRGSRDTYSGTKRREVLWSPGEQTLAGGWMASRTTAQFLTVRSRASDAGLRFLPAGGGEPARVENHLGTRVERLYLADDAGTLYEARDVAPGAKATLAEVQETDARKALSKIAVEHRPVVQAGMEQASDYGFGWSNMRRYWSPWSTSAPAADLQSSRLERELMGALDPTAHGGVRATGTFLEPRSYVAVVERSPEVALGVDNPLEAGSLHVVQGQW